MKRVRLSSLVLVCLLIVGTNTTSRVRAQSPASPPTQTPAAPSQPAQPSQPTPPSAPSTPPPSQPQPTFRVGATYVRVDAYVTKDGKPVSDLTKDDFEVYEDGVRQNIRNFEFVSIPSGVLQTTPRTDPNTVADMRERVADPRRRVFVIYLDTYHSSLGSSMAARKAFQRFVEHLVGPDDLMAGMTPEMLPEALTFASRTEAMTSFLDSIWGRRDAIRQDPDEDYMQSCFTDPAIASQWPRLRDKRRTKLTLDSIDDLIKHIGDLREERKAIVLVSEGWALYRDNPELNRLTDPKGVRPIHAGPVYVPPMAGKDPNDSTMPTNGMCEKIIMDLANMETIQQFRDLPDKANRANASFYIVDPRGLPASDDLLNSPSPSADLDSLSAKLNQMRELAERTDGMAFANTNNLDAELTRIVQDVSSYYLLGYDSTNGKLDGSYRGLSVKVKRPGVLVRARKGYRAAVLPSASAPPSRTGANTGAPGGTAASASGGGPANEVASRIGAVMGTRANLPVRLRATSVRLLNNSTSNGPSQPLSELRVIAELDPKLAASDAWRLGGTAHFIVKGEGNDAPLAGEATLQPGAHVLTTTITLPPAFTIGDYRVQMRLSAQSHTDALSDSTTVHVEVPGLIGSPSLFRRGPATGTSYVATADPRFSRADRLRLEAPSRVPASQIHVSAVNQMGQPLTLPVQVADRQDGAVTLIVADVTLAPLAPGGYAIVLANGAQERIIVPFELIP